MEVLDLEISTIAQIQELAAILRNTMQNETELIEIGIGLLETHKYKKSIEIFTQAIQINPINSEIFELRGIANFKLFAIDEALSDTSKAIEIDVENHRAWYNKGEILKYKAEYEEAEYCYRQADKIYPQSLFYLTGLIETTLAQKKYAETISFCTQILNDLPADIIALTKRGFAYSQQLNYQAGINDYLKLVELGKRNATIYTNLGFWYGKLGLLKKASNNLSVALQINPTHPYALNNLGYVNYLEGNNKKALELINKSLEIDPSNSYAYKNRALVSLKNGQKETALIDLNKAKSLGYTEDYDNEVAELLKNEYGIG